mgnify:CR=1 FL=1
MVGLYVIVSGKNNIINMKKQETLDSFNEQIRIENYSEELIENYLYAVRLLLEWVENL